MFSAVVEQRVRIRVGCRSTYGRCIFSFHDCCCITQTTAVAVLASMQSAVKQRIDKSDMGQDEHIEHHNTY